MQSRHNGEESFGGFLPSVLVLSKHCPPNNVSTEHHTVAALMLETLCTQLQLDFSVTQFHILLRFCQATETSDKLGQPELSLADTWLRVMVFSLTIANISEA